MLPGRYEGHRDFALGEKLDRAEWEALDARFRELYPAVLTGRARPAELRAVAEPMGLTPGLRFDRRWPDAAPERLSDGVLADIAENSLPDLGTYAMERVLGPLAELHLSRSARRAVGATLAFARLAPQALRPVDRLYREKPRPPVALRAAVKAVELCPPLLWARDGDHLHPLLPLAPRFVPPGPVQGLPPGPAVLGRAVPTAAGDWWLACALPLPCVPDPDALMRRLTWELWRMRRHEMRLTWEDLLRERAEVLTRTAFEWCFEVGAAPRGGDWRWPDW